MTQAEVAQHLTRRRIDNLAEANETALLPVNALLEGYQRKTTQGQQDP